MPMHYAVVKSGGKQYRVSEGQDLTLDRLKLDGKKSFVFEDVLLVVDNNKVTIGAPFVKGATVEATLIEEIRGEKLYIRRFKAKSRYRRVTGFRAEQSVVKISKINLDKKNLKVEEEKKISKEDR